MVHPGEMESYEPHEEIDEILWQVDSYVWGVSRARKDEHLEGEIPEEVVWNHLPSPMEIADPLDPQDKAQAIEKKKREVITSAEAREILGKDFFGIEEFEPVEQRIRASGISLTKMHPSKDLRIYRTDVETAKMKGERVFILPWRFQHGKGHTDVTLNNVLGLITPVFTEKEAEDVTRSEHFASTPISTTVLYLQKDPLYVPRGTPEEEWWEKIEEYENGLPVTMRDRVELPTVSELVLADLIYGINTGESLLAGPARTVDLTPDGEVLCFNGHNENGFLIHPLPPASADKLTDIYLVR